MCFIGRREVINQTSFVDVFVVGSASATISSTTSTPLLETSIPTLTPESEFVSETDGSPDSPVPTNVPSMFSTSMSPPRSTPAGEEGELITTVAPTIKEEHQENDDITAAPLQYTTGSPGTTGSVEETDDHSVIEVGTIQPDVPITDASLSTEPMFAEGKTEETIVGTGITTAMTSDHTDTPTESTELTSEEVFSSSESTHSPTGLHSTTPFPDYDPGMDEIETGFVVEGAPPPQPPQGSSSTPSDSTAFIDGTKIPTALPTDTTFMCNTEPGKEASHQTGPPETTQTATDEETPAVVHKEENTTVTMPSATVLTDGGPSAELGTSSTSVFEESITQVTEHSGDTLTEVDTATEVGLEFFTSAPMSLAVADATTTPGTAVAEEQSIQSTTSMQVQNISGNNST